MTETSSNAPSSDRDPPTTFAGDCEWLLTDGRGGYACGTAQDLAMRRYHGLWVARARGGAKRQMVVAGLDERVASRAAPDAVEYLMHAHWHDQAQPSPPRAAVRFARRPLPTWTFDTAVGAVERSVALHRVEGAGDDAPYLLVRWRNRSARALRLSVRPLLGWCDVDHLVRASDVDGTIVARGASWGCRPDTTLPTLWMTADGVAAFRGEAAWYRGFLQATDRARGYDFVGDRWCPGVMELDLGPASGPGAEATVAFRLDAPCTAPAAAFDLIAAAATAQWTAARTAPERRRARLALGADDFLYRADGGRLGVLAGFPWFGEWGRDVFLALPGLTLARGDRARCREVLTGALPFLVRGLLPNIYGATIDDSDYGSCDAALWFALAVTRLADAPPEDPDEAALEAELLRERLVPALVSIVDAYVAGTGLGLRATKDGLLAAGGPELNATWMDARTSQGPVTPREGFPVEIQALWCSLLAFLVECGETRFAALHERCAETFVARFWLAEEGRLADRVHDGVPDRAVRPNMLVAAALPRAPLSREQREGVVAAAEHALVTPVGLRTLSPDHPDYRRRYEGGPEQRDSAYHQGTVWPWPAGFYVEAALRAARVDEHGDERAATAARLREWLTTLCAELDRAGIDHVSEVFDGDPPHRPGGTFAQAWNTGELLRAFTLCDAPPQPWSSRPSVTVAKRPVGGAKKPRAPRKRPRQ